MDPEASRMLTGYNLLSISDVVQPGLEKEIIPWPKVLDLYMDTTQCSSVGWEVPETRPTKELLNRSWLFGQLPWLNGALTECFESPSGQAKVLLLC